MINLWINSETNALLPNWNAFGTTTLPQIKQGDTIAFDIHWVKSDPAGQFMEEVVIPPLSVIKVAVGIPNGSPSGGYFVYNFLGDTVQIPYNATAAEADTLINGLPSIISAGGVVVSLVNQRTYRIVFNEFGTRAISSCDSTPLSPSTIISVIRINAGGPTSKEVQHLRPKLLPVAYSDSFTSSPEPVISIANIDSITKRISISPSPKFGTFTISNGTGTTSALSINSSAGDVLKGLNDSGISSATRTYSVAKSGDYSWDIYRTSGTSETLTITTTGLIGFSSKTGTVSFNTLEVEDLLAGQPSVTATIEVEYSYGDVRQTLYQGRVTIVNDIIDEATYNPVPFPELQAGIEEAPTDGVLYGRKDGLWSAVIGDGNNIPDYDNTIIYTVGSQVYYQGGLYRMIFSAGVADVEPSTNPTYWESLSGGDLSNYVSKTGSNEMDVGSAIVFPSSFGTTSISQGGVGVFDGNDINQSSLGAFGLQVTDADGTTQVMATGIQFPDSTIQTTAANPFDPTGYAQLSGATFTGAVTMDGANFDIRNNPILSSVNGQNRLLISSTFGFNHEAEDESFVLRADNQGFLYANYDDNGGVINVARLLGNTGLFVQNSSGDSMGINGSSIRFKDNTEQVTAFTGFSGYATESWVIGYTSQYLTIDSYPITALKNAYYFNYRTNPSGTYSFDYFDGYSQTYNNITVVITAPIGWTYHTWNVLFTAGFPLGTVEFDNINRTLYLGTYSTTATLQDAINTYSTSSSAMPSGWTATFSNNGSPYAQSDALVNGTMVNLPIIDLNSGASRALLSGGVISDLTVEARNYAEYNKILSTDANGNVGWYSTPPVLNNYALRSGTTFTGKVNLPPSTSNSAFLNLGAGVTVASPQVGDVWMDVALRYRTSSGLNLVGAASNTTNTFTSPQIIDTLNSTPALRVTQRGGGPSLVVEDSTNPDINAFVVNSSGIVGIGRDPSTWTPSAGVFLDVAGRAVFTPTVTNASINIGSLASSPTTTSNGDVWIGNFNMFFRDNSGNIRTIPNLQTQNSFTNSQVITNPTNATLPTLRLTNTATVSTVNSFVVEDATNPDTSSFVIDHAGNVGVGVNPATWVATQKFEVQGNVKFSNNSVQTTAYIPSAVEITGGTIDNITIDGGTF